MQQMTSGYLYSGSQYNCSNIYQEIKNRKENSGFSGNIVTLNLDIRCDSCRIEFNKCDTIRQQVKLFLRRFRLSVFVDVSPFFHNVSFCTELRFVCVDAVVSLSISSLLCVAKHSYRTGISYIWDSSRLTLVFLVSVVAVCLTFELLIGSFCVLICKYNCNQML